MANASRCVPRHAMRMLGSLIAARHQFSISLKCDEAKHVDEKRRHPE